MDGTLIDTEPYWIRCEHELVAAYGGRWTDDDAMSIVGFDLMDAAEVIRTRGGVPLRPHEIVDKLSAAVTALVRERIPWRPGGARAARRPQAARRPVRPRHDVVAGPHRRGRRPAAPRLVPDRDHRRHGDERQTPSRALPPRRRGARCRSAGVCRHRGLAARHRLGRGGWVRGRRRAQPRADPRSPASRRAVDAAGGHPGAARRVRRAHSATPDAAVTGRAIRTDAAEPPRRIPPRSAAGAAMGRPRSRRAPPRRRRLVVRHPRHRADATTPGRSASTPGSRRGTSRTPSTSWNRERNMFHQISPFWYEVTGVSTIQPYANTPRGGDRRVRRQGARPRHPARRLAVRPHGTRRDGGDARRPRVAGRPHRRHRRLRRRARLPGHRHQLRELRLQRRAGHVGDDTPGVGDVHRGALRPPPRRRAVAHRQRAAGVRRRADRGQRVLGLRLRGRSPRTSTPSG